MADPRPTSEKPVKTGVYTSNYEPVGGAGGSVEQEVSYIADEILIKYKDTTTASEIASFETSQGLDKIEEFPFVGSILYLTPTDPIIMTRALRENPIIEFIEPNLVRGISGESPSEVQRTLTGTSNLQTGSLVGIAVVVGLFLLLRK
jgi:hypothetical protein